MPQSPRRSPDSRAARRSLLVLLVSLHAFVGVLIAFAPRLSIAIPNSIVRPEHGAAYIASLRYGRGGALFRLPADTPSAPTNSRLRLFEDGKELGPAHAPHAAIREHGGGRFSHWGGSLRFSTTDGSDPRHNGRVYSIASPVAPQLSWIVGLVALDLGLAIALRRGIFSFLASNGGRKLLVCCSMIVLALVGLISAGLFGPINLTADGAPKDPALVLSVVAHAVIGCATTIAAWAAGAGLVRLIVRDPHASPTSILLPAFPAALLALAALSGVALATPHGRTAASILWFMCLLPLAAWRPHRHDVVRLLTALSAIAPCGLLFGAWIGLLWHGPTATLAGSPSGDMSFYASHMWSLAARAYPFIDLTYADGPAVSYFNMLFSAAGAAVLPLPGFDPFLFLLAGGAMSYVILSALMLHLYVADRARGALDPFAAMVLALSLIVAARYPSWTVESAPMIFVPGLTIAVWWMVERGRADSRWGIVALAAAIAGSALSKVVTAVTLVPIAATSLWRRLSALGPFAKAAALTLACGFAIYAVAMLWRQLPVYLAAAKPGPDSLAWPLWWFWWRDAGALALAILAWRIADRPVALAVIGGLIAFLAFPFLLYANFVCAVLVLGLIHCTRDETSAAWRLFAVAAFGCALPAVLLSDPSGPATGVAWLVCFGGAILIAIAAAARIGELPDRLRLREAALIGISALALGAFGLFGVARGHIIVTSGWHSGEPELTPEVRDIWSAVRHLTPPDALIFTDQIGDTPDNETPQLLRGWNTYAKRGQRQVFLANYYSVPELRIDPARRRRILAINELVLKGAVAPGEVSTARRHGSFFAVVAKSRTVPTAWQPIHQNGKYNLYGVRPDPASANR